MDTARSTASLSSLPNDNGQDLDTPSQNVAKTKEMAPPIIVGAVIVATMLLVVLVVLLRRFCTRRSVYRSLNASPPHDNDDSHLPNMNDLEKATSTPPTERDPRDKKRARKFKGMTWKRISPFELGRGKSNRKRSWVFRQSGAQDGEGNLPQFDSDALVSRRISKEPEEQVPTVTSQTENTYLRVEVEDIESEDAGEERIDTKEFESIVETSGVAMTPRWRSSMYSGVSSADTTRASMISNFGTDYTDYKDEDGSYAQPPTLSIPTVLYRKKAGGGLTPSAASSPILTSPVAGLGHSPVLLRTDPDAIMSPSAESVDSLRLEVQQLREGIRRLVDHQESGWANPGYREPTYEERPPDYGASVANSDVEVIK
ncbi:hypothetical protein VNI00_000655 [Paramarasmius palmivorus]|uniref:Uncharacterized protein n=1 Tax=Paramarasmius palmivorus TaxID=297713 RepID=A0AAW0EBV0_9AGAR